LDSIQFETHVMLAHTVVMLYEILIQSLFHKDKIKEEISENL